MTTRTREHFSDDDDDEKEEVVVNIVVKGKGHQIKLKKGIRVREAISKANPTFEYKKGLTFMLNGRALNTNKQTGELLEDPVLEENNTLVVQDSFVGGPQE